MEIDLETREVYYKDKRIGVTAIFLWPVPEKEEEIMMAETDNLTIHGKVREIRVQHIRGYGFQKLIQVEYNYSLTCIYKGRYTSIVRSVVVYYDIDTGIMVKGILPPEPLLLIADIMAIAPYVRIVKTDVDIGPSDTMFELGTIILRILYIVLLVSPIILAIFVIIKRRE